MSGVGDLTCFFYCFFYSVLAFSRFQTASLSFDLIAVSILSLISWSENFHFAVTVTNIFVISWFVWSNQNCLNLTGITYRYLPLPLNKSPLNLTGIIFFIVKSPTYVLMKVVSVISSSPSRQFLTIDSRLTVTNI